MKLVAATLYALHIPFIEAFQHSAKTRTFCDSIVIRVEDENGTVGYGEGVPRSYVTGETSDFMLKHLAQTLWPAVREQTLPSLQCQADLGDIDALIPQQETACALSDNASRAALELAIVDCTLRRQRMSLGQILPPCRQRVTYSGVITAGSLTTALQHAQQMKLIGLKQIKVKVGAADDVTRLYALRHVLGPEVSLRIDANGAWIFDQASLTLNAIAPLHIAAVEQPLARRPATDFARLKQFTSVPLMADESLVTLADAEALIAHQAVEYFNVRISKCGGLFRSLVIAKQAARAGIHVQLGSHVGETAILSAAGRHLAAALENVAFVEGSYGTLLLSEDLSVENIRFGHRGEAPLLTGPGLGVRVCEERLRKYARTIVDLV